MWLTAPEDVECRVEPFGGIEWFVPVLAKDYPNSQVPSGWALIVLTTTHGKDLEDWASIAPVD
jgi:hypothetical protein